MFAQKKMTWGVVLGVMFAGLPLTSHAGTGSRGIHRLAEAIGSTGFLIIITVVIVLVIVGVVMSGSSKKKFTQKQTALHGLKTSPPPQKQDAIRQLAQCFFMGPNEFTGEQAAHNIEVLDLLCQQVEGDGRQKLQQYREKFAISPVKFGLLESCEMEKHIESLAK